MDEVLDGNDPQVTGPACFRHKGVLARCLVRRPGVDDTTPPTWIGTPGACVTMLPWNSKASFPTTESTSCVA